MIFIALLQLAAAGPSFDCARARTDIERSICAHAELAALDREEARIYGIARVVPRADRAALLKRQRDFLEERNTCPESAAPLEECLRDVYLDDIGELRRVSELQDDNEGISSGPLLFHCDGNAPDVYVTLFGTSPAQAYLAMPGANEGQPLLVDPADPQRFVGRYATDMVYEADSRRVRYHARICTP
ncbi:MAG: hypothetical protein E6G92_00980 [Alphaproteobacteria bacterium]|nr:MAG: hypothetical protein E6G92_00980 [Alphaproteobacteria bacterium]